MTCTTRVKFTRTHSHLFSTDNDRNNRYKILIYTDDFELTPAPLSQVNNYQTYLNN